MLLVIKQKQQWKKNEKRITETRELPSPSPQEKRVRQNMKIKRRKKWKKYIQAGAVPLKIRFFVWHTKLNNFNGFVLRAIFEHWRKQIGLHLFANGFCLLNHTHTHTHSQRKNYYCTPHEQNRCFISFVLYLSIFSLFLLCEYGCWLPLTRGANKN